MNGDHAKIYDKIDSLEDHILGLYTETATLSERVKNFTDVVSKQDPRIRKLEGKVWMGIGAAGAISTLFGIIVYTKQIGMW